MSTVTLVNIWDGKVDNIKNVVDLRRICYDKGLIGHCTTEENVIQVCVVVNRYTGISIYLNTVTVNWITIVNDNKTGVTAKIKGSDVKETVGVKIDVLVKVVGRTY